MHSTGVCWSACCGRCIGPVVWTWCWRVQPNDWRAWTNYVSVTAEGIYSSSDALQKHNHEISWSYISELALRAINTKSFCGCVPGTFCMMLATRALKWERMSLSVSESLSFSASRSCRVRSTYSSRVLFREWDSPSRPPLALHREYTNTLLFRIQKVLGMKLALAKQRSLEILFQISFAS